jgi:hypothetical protein
MGYSACVVASQTNGDYPIMTLIEYRRRCRIEANRQWAYAGLVEDHADRVVQAWELKETPADFIRWLGEKYDLIPAELW